MPRALAPFLPLALLPALWALPASADDGPARTVPPPGRPAISVLRPADLAALVRHLDASVDAGPQLIIVIGGFASAHDDAAFDALRRRYDGDPRYEIVRFGAGSAHYDTTGTLDANARALLEEIRSRSPHYARVHLVTHSMGGAVADRAFAQGLSAADGVRTYVALAAPHDGAGAAFLSTLVLGLAGPDAEEIRSVARLAGHNIGAPAVEDLAWLRAGPPPPGVARLDVRLATDALVTRQDGRTPGVEARTLLPDSLDDLEGHGAVLTDPRVVDLVRATIADGVPPPDRRSAVLRRAADEVDAATEILARVALAAAAAGILASLLAARAERHSLSGRIRRRVFGR
ncbi:MAG: esterase/lipase family protein [Candidatus Limnocylindria bacterium]